MITDKERAQMADDIEGLAGKYEADAELHSIYGKTPRHYGAKSMAENYRALARALREGKPFEVVA